MASRTIVILRWPRSGPRRTHTLYPALLFALTSLMVVPALAQQPTPLFNAQPLPAPAGPSSDQLTPSLQPPPPPSVPATPAPPIAVPGRVFCDQNVTAQPADRSSVPERYRPLIGIFSDADWNPQTCAALIVENVAEDGTATITYIFGPLGPGSKTPGGVLHGTGIIKDGALLFQNSDGSQYAFKPFYDDLAGKWTPPTGVPYEAVFKRTF
jgi:hypothetical protein